MTEINQIGNPLLQDLAIRPEKKEQELGKNAFLELMVAQLNNQDPLNPQENGEFIAQLAQFSSVEGIENLNSTVQVMSSSLQSSQALQASALVGRKVHVNSGSSYLAAGGDISGNIKLDSSTSNLMLSISNSAGVLVDQVAMGTHTAGKIKFDWNGQDANGQPFAPGEYFFKAEAVVGGAAEQVPTSLSANVDSVTINPDRSVVLNIAGLGSVPLLEVEEIL